MPSGESVVLHTGAAGQSMADPARVLSSAVVFGTTSRGRPNAEIHAILDRAVCGITSDDENLFAACALNFAGSHIRLHGEVVVSYLAHTRAWQWHIDICARLDIATAQRTAWDTLWDDRRQSRTAQLRQAIKSGSTETDESARARLPVCLRSAYQALLGSARPKYAKVPGLCLILAARRS